MGLAPCARMTQVLRVPKIFDISVPVANGAVVYPGNPDVRIEPHSQLSRGASSNLSLISFGSHTGTHVDAPRHFFDAGSPVDQLPLNALIGPARVIGVEEDVMSVTAKHLQKEPLQNVERLLIRTRNSGFVKDREFHPDFTFIAPDGAEYLAALGVKLVGVDYYSVEQFHSGHHRTHRTLLERGIVIVEGLDLSEISPGEYEFACLPLRLEGLDGAPARAVLMKR
jgi:arylformamidase